MLTHHLAQSKNILPPLPKRWKTETFQNESGFYWRKWTWNVFNWSILRMNTASYCRDYKLTIIILSLTLWWNGAYGKLRRFKNDYCLWLNCCQLPQSINLFFPTFLLSIQQLRWHLPPQGRKFPDRKAPRFVWCKAIYGSICYTAVTKLPSISTWWSRTHAIFHLVLHKWVGSHFSLKNIPHICHERHEYIRVNFFWPV